VRTTLLNAKNSRIPNALGMCSTDTRLVQYLNEAIQRLVMMPQKWWGTYQKYRVCEANGCITWPRQFATIEAAAICDCPITIRGQWFEFLENGYGLRGETDGVATQLFDRDTVVTFDDIQSPGYPVAVYADVAEDADAELLVQGHDENGNWIRTQHNGVWVNGEYIPIQVGTYNVSTKTFYDITGIIKPQTNGTVRLYEYDAAGPTYRALGIYEYDETNPYYRRSVISGLSNRTACDSSGDDCESKAVTVIAKMEYIPVAQDNDWLLIGNLMALKFMCLAIQKEENDLWDEAKKFEANAISILDKELGHYLGDGEVIGLRFPSRLIWGGAVENVIDQSYTGVI
jgi:hypothetical protein